MRSSICHAKRKGRAVDDDQVVCSWDKDTNGSFPEAWKQYNNIW